ncbi:Hypothetical protein R9X50_00005200 [Acrodontium crateriforme]|uniref:Pisatin demethylase n=1 Tax=Acrodontium crateriforme TaxID=150365 RepID=A0AAQ3LWJ9_9PEZI|nr:Hypothetical protein R9X50_00005200 [Acrodontium crateriforme]
MLHISQLLVALPFLLIVRFVLYRYASPLRKYPGPFLASGSRAWKVWSTWGGHTEKDHIRIHEKYGPIVRIAPNELSFSSPNAAKDILAAGKGFHKTDFYAVFPPPENPDIFTETREAVHAVKKRYASHPYSMASMQKCAGCIEDTQRLLQVKLDNICANTSGTQQTSSNFDLGDYLHFYAFDVLGEVAFSRKFGFIEAGFDIEGAIKTIDDMQWYDGIVGQISEWDFVFRRNPLWKFIPGMNPQNFLITRMALEEMDKRKKGVMGTDRSDLMNYLLAAHEKAPETFLEGDVFAVAHGAIFAGSDSTASTMQSFCHYVLREREIYNRLVAEIDSATAKGELSEMPQWDQAQALPYFQACLKEALRIRPAVGLNITRLVPAGGASINGEPFPGGTRVALNGWVINRSIEVFGPSPDVFRPERWLDGERDVKAMDRALATFGGGSHLCIGKNLALLEINKTLPWLFRNYGMELVRPEKELEYHSTFFVVQKGLNVKIWKRTKG